MNPTIFDKIGGTKFALSILAILVGAAIELLTPRGVSPSFAGLLAGIVAAYGAANAMITTSVNKNSSSEDTAVSQPQTPQVDLSPVITKLDAQDADISAIKDTITKLGEFAKNTHKIAQAALTVVNK